MAHKRLSLEEKREVVKKLSQPGRPLQKLIDLYKGSLSLR